MSREPQMLAVDTVSFNGTVIVFGESQLTSGKYELWCKVLDLQQSGLAHLAPCCAGTEV